MDNYPPRYDSQAYNAAWGGQSLEAHVSRVMKSVYFKMTLALVVTAFVSLFCSSSMSYLYWIAQHSWAMWVLVIAEFGIVIGVSAGINKLSSTTASLLFYLFAVINGLLLAPVFIVYTDTSIAKTFFITAGTFGAMSVYGYFTNRDLTKMGSILIMALFGLIIASLVNIFFHSQGLELVITYAGVLIFVGLTAWDTQQIKRMAQQAPADTAGRLATLGALNLYLDFINLFLYLLRIFGDRD